MNGPILRLLDANCNRAREALRVLEDYARFVRDDADLTESLKHLRHDFSSATGPWLADAILHRDTPGDVGTPIKTLAEQHRLDLAHVVTAAGKRLGEALRSIEEYLKTFSPVDAARVEKIRYAFYDLEKIIAAGLHASSRFAAVRLYVLITESLCSGPWLRIAEEVLLGGADCLQLREKNLESGELLKRARQLTALCRRAGKMCIINDRPDVALLSGADGVHVGQEDLPAAEIRKIVGRELLVGVSTHQIDQAHQARRDGADYIGVGPIFRSQTKPRDVLPGTAYAREAATLGLPAVAIAGITFDNLDEVLATGLGAVAVSSAIISSPDPLNQARRFKARLTRADQN